MSAGIPLKLASFAERFPAEMAPKVEKLMNDLEQAAANKLNSLIVEPVDVGTLKQSRGTKANGKGVSIGYTAVHAITVDIGRIKSKTYRRTLRSGKKSKLFSRMLGSAKVPEGMTQPAIRKLKAVWDEVAESAGKDF